MFTSMDRGFGDDVFRKMERLKMKRSLDNPFIRDKGLDIEETIAFENE